MQTLSINEILTVDYKNGYRFKVCKHDEGKFIIMRFNYYNYGLNLSSEKEYKQLAHAIIAGKNILTNHLKRQGYIKK